MVIRRTLRLASLLLAGLLLNASAAAQPFRGCAASANNATVIIPSEGDVAFEGEANGWKPAAGDEIALFTPDGHCAGKGTWDGSTLAIAVAGADDQGTKGYTSGKKLRFKVWDASADTRFGTGIVYASCGSDESVCVDDGRYVQDAIYRVSRFEDAGSDESNLIFTIGRPYPNPSSGRARFTLRVREAQTVSVNVYNMLGQHVMRVYDGRVEAGTRRLFTIDFTSGDHALPSGVYLCRVQGNDFLVTRRLVLVR